MSSRFDRKSEFLSKLLHFLNSITERDSLIVHLTLEDDAFFERSDFLIFHLILWEKYELETYRRFVVL